MHLSHFRLVDLPLIGWVQEGISQLKSRSLYRSLTVFMTYHGLFSCIWRVTQPTAKSSINFLPFLTTKLDTGFKHQKQTDILQLPIRVMNTHVRYSQGNLRIRRKKEADNAPDCICPVIYDRHVSCSCIAQQAVRRLGKRESHHPRDGDAQVGASTQVKPELD
ncbi:hypothetical protein BDV38DRAFT_19861 [Aspergillus pseudotamarii]|uniref:Uncharacterized protein n=1 Tax=Aspergillus pseudotamarii TaxID=132259 RepID=A0A5N6T2R2_ASPPS|nr:uncharacterized protein BDV38DRAFT_19861 [Aspergillus pseudotamarii]KAE8140595.1 hypothetical protein BDV38DRAFT_19861 [Aspergillus pseudotamarii]